MYRLLLVLVLLVDVQGYKNEERQSSYEYVEDGLSHFLKEKFPIYTSEYNAWWSAQNQSDPSSFVIPGPFKISSPKEDVSSAVELEMSDIAVLGVGRPSYDPIIGGDFLSKNISIARMAWSGMLIPIAVVIVQAKYKAQGTMFHGNVSITGQGSWTCSNADIYEEFHLVDFGITEDNAFINTSDCAFKSYRGSAYIRSGGLRWENLTWSGNVTWNESTTSTIMAELTNLVDTLFTSNSTSLPSLMLPGHPLQKYVEHLLANTPIATIRTYAPTTTTPFSETTPSGVTTIHICNLFTNVFTGVFMLKFFYSEKNPLLML